LLPYPHHRDRHQLAHALLLERHGAALTCIDEIDAERTVESLWPPLAALMGDDARRAQMRQAARELNKPDAAERIAERMVELASCRAIAAT
jgi:UDP-N-acetylglucosamine--N-acetylmuramyl-(pentapeptide) pyrophosphoryl-undecaprenol N-acetylglucosamine transferase